MTADRHLSRFAVDAHLVDGDRAPAPAGVEAHLAICERCRALVAAAREERDRIAAALPRRRRLPRSDEGWIGRRWWLALPALATLVLLVILVQPRAPSIWRKGGPALRVFARHEGRTFVVADGARLAPGDQLRLVLEPGDATFALVVSIDGAGHASVYHPFGGAASARLAAAPRAELSDSIILDDAPGPERIFVLLSRKPIAASGVLAKLSALGAAGADSIRHARSLPVDDALHQLTLSFEKTAP